MYVRERELVSERERERRTAGQSTSIWGEVVPEDGMVDVATSIELDSLLYGNHPTLVLCMQSKACT